MKNANLKNARKAKNDEFYTQLKDIEAELQHYKPHFDGAIVYCPCDDPKKSEFFTYFALNFKKLKLKKAIFTYYDPDNPVYKVELTEDNNIIKTPLEGNGDFRSEECIEILKEADIVVTNPPFSLFRDFMAWLEKYQ